MGNPALKERRLSNRKKPTGLLPGKMQTIDGKDIHCQPIDVSEHGMGFISDTEFDAGDIIKLVLKDTEISLEIAWAQGDFGKKDKFRYGTITLDKSLDIESLFLKAGCLV
jgi:hypothetical protein